MIWLNDYVETIEKLLGKEDVASLTYAALEVRLALERFCYERLKIGHEYISHDDLRGWTPKYIVTTLLEMVDTNVASEFTLSISSTPTPEEMTQPEYEQQEWVKIGTQKGFDPKNLSKQWQAMGSFLHTGLPKSENDQIRRYAEIEKIRGKVDDALNFLKELQTGTLNSVFPGETITFACSCGHTNKRPAFSLKPNALISCVKENCVEMYRVEKCGTAFEFERLKILISCQNCQTEHRFPYHTVKQLDKNHFGKFKCDGCGDENIFTWKLMQVKKSEATATKI